MGHRQGSDLVLLWLWRRLASVVPIRPLAWEPPYAVGVALEKTKDKKKKNAEVSRSKSIFAQNNMCLSLEVA